MKIITNEQEIIETINYQSFLIEKQLTNSILSFKDLSSLPGLYYLSSSTDYSLIKTCNATEKALLYPLDEIKKMGENYVTEIVHKEDLPHILLNLQNFLSEDNEGKPYAYFQRTRVNYCKDHQTHYTTTKKVIGQNEIFNISVPVENMGMTANKILRVLEETEYMRRNYQKFARLTAREKEIITLLALGYQNSEIAEQLFISKATVEQHRKNLKRKLEIKRFVDLIRFAQAFDLI